MALYSVGTSPKIFTYYGNHYHEYYELILNLEGEGRAFMGEKEYPFSPGTIHIVPPHMPHRKESKQGFRDIYFHTDTIYPGPDGAGGKYFSQIPIILNDDADKTMESILSTMLTRYLQKKKNDVILDSLYHIALQLIWEWYENVHLDPVINNIIQQLTLSFNDPEFKISSVLLATGYSQDHIRRRFHHATGMTPGEFLTEMRIRYAAQLLSQKNNLHLSVGDVGMMCGYYDSRYFSRIFKERMGMTPTEYACISHNETKPE